MRISPELHESVIRENAALREQVAALTTEVGRLAELVAQSKDRIAELLAVAGRKKSRSKRRPPAPAPSPLLDADAQAAYLARPKAPPRPAKVRAAKKPRRPTGRKPVPEHLPTEEHRLGPEACKRCGGVDLEVVDEVVETKLHSPPRGCRWR